MCTIKSKFVHLGGILMSIGKQMRLRREELGLSRAELAKELGVSPSAISNYENGVSSPKEDILLKLFNALRIDPNYLYRDFFRAEAPDFSHEEHELIAQYRALPPRGREAARTLIASLRALCGEATQGPPSAPRRLPLYHSLAAVGEAAPVQGVDFDYISDDGTVPHGAEFAVQTPENAAPPLPRGSRIFADHAPLAAGDIGLFFVDGRVLCRQYCRDLSGAVRLLSLDRTQSAADLIFPPGDAHRFACMGRVLPDQHTASGNAGKTGDLRG